MARQAGFRPNSSASALVGIGFNSTEMLARNSPSRNLGYSHTKASKSKNRMMRIVNFHLEVTERKKVNHAVNIERIRNY